MQEDHQNAPTGPVDAVNRRFLRLIGDEGGPLVWIWGIFAAFSLGMTVLSAAIQIRTNAPLLHELLQNPGAMPQAGQPQEVNLAALLLYPVIWIAITLYYGTLSAVREVDARSGQMSFAEARPLVFERFLPTLLATLVFGFASGLGAMCCIIPGFVAMFFLYLAPYLTAAHGMSPGEAISTSIEWSKRHWVLVLMLVGIATLVSVGSMAMQFVSVATFHGMLGSTGILVGSLVTWAMGSIVGYFLWVYSGAVMITIARAETNPRPGLRR